MWYGLGTRTASSGVVMKRLFVAVGLMSAGLLAWAPTSTAASSAWHESISFTNQVASKPIPGGGYPVPPGSITAPSQTGPSNTYIYPSVDANGDLYVAFASFPINPNRGPATIYVSRSIDDGVSFLPFVAAATVGTLPAVSLPNTTFRDGITESFAASPTHPGHLYLTYEDWDGTDMDVKFTQSTDGGNNWSPPKTVNDNDDAGAPTDQFQPSIAAGPGGAVAVAFYDRREACPNDPSVLPADVGRTNFCIDTSLQAYTDNGSGAEPVGTNYRISEYTWDPMNPAQHVDGLGQMACAGHTDPCRVTFIGDYFGLAISDTNIYALFVSTHYPSNVNAEEGGKVYYQQQVLSTGSQVRHRE
jgi:hypothetical protein